MERDKRLEDTVSFFRKEFGEAPKFLVVLGSGWNRVIDSLHLTDGVDFSSIPGFSDATVKGHEGRLFIFEEGGMKTIFMQGRIHYYEGRGMDSVVYPVISMARWGVGSAIFTNAAGGIADSISPGDVVVIRDHISLFCPNPLIGVKDSFIGMVNCYSPSIRHVLKESSKDAGFSVHEGVYVYLTGPSFETPSEIRVLRSFGADVVGMSTVPEVIVAKRYGMDVGAISFVSNRAASEDVELKHEDVLAIIGKNSSRLTQVIVVALRKLSGR